MKNKNKKVFLRVAATILTVVLALSLSVSCSKSEEKAVPDPVLECGDEKLPLYFYEFMLSRIKGSLARNEYDVTSDEFWNSIIGESGKTYEQYYNDAVLESCKNYLAAAVLFDREGLTLPQSKLDEIDEEIAFYIDYDGKDDKEKFNKLIAKYGVDADTLRECYIIEAKYEQVVSSLYGEGGLIDKSLKEEYYRENYVRFKQVLFPKFYYEYEKDGNGDLIYFDTETGHPLYDTVNGSAKFDDDDNRIKDKYGEVIYYDADGNILYDKENGKLSVKLEDGEGVRHGYSEEKIAEQRAAAEALASKIEKGKFASFEAEIKLEEAKPESLDNPYPDGYYLGKTESAGYEGYMSGIFAKLGEMEVGEVAVYESDEGFHVIMKYELDDGKYEAEGYGEWFANFENSLIDMLFANRVKSILPLITVNEENLAKVKSIVKIGTNFNY